LNALDATIAEVFRREHGRIIATLIRVCGSFELAEEAMQEAFASALLDWRDNGVPRSPGAWITTTARNKLVDVLRRDRTRKREQDAVGYEIELRASEDDMSDFDAEHHGDDRLRLIFTCCHPALNREAQIALTLRTLGGLTTTAIARAFLLPEPTLAQRLVRAQRKIKTAKIPYQVPSTDALPERLASVRSVLYLIFNEGYVATQSTELVSGELCTEAIRLTRMLCELLPNDPESLGLLALMLLHDSRRNARVDANGDLVTLDEQDRSMWDRAMIIEGAGLVETALLLGQPGPYQLQAAIAAVHAEALTAAETDWPQIAALYAELEKSQPTPIVALNRAVAVGMSEGPAQGLALLEQLHRHQQLDGYHLYHAARADVLRRLELNDRALEAYRAAIALTTNAAERRFLEKRIASLATRNT